MPKSTIENNVPTRNQSTHWCEANLKFRAVHCGHICYELCNFDGPYAEHENMCENEILRCHHGLPIRKTKLGWFTRRVVSSHVGLNHQYQTSVRCPQLF